MMEGSLWRVLTKDGPLEKMKTTSEFLQPAHEQSEKAKRWTLQDELPRLVDVNMLLEKSGYVTQKE